MARAKLIIHEGVRVLEVDLSGIADLTELEAELAAGSALVRQEPATASLRVLVDLRGVPYSLHAYYALLDAAKANDPYVLARAVIGLDPLGRFALGAFARVAGRPVRLFERREEALSWLADLG